MREEEAVLIRTKTMHLVLEVLCIGDNDGREYLLMHLCNWYQAERPWRVCIEAALDEMVKSDQCYVPITINISTDSAIRLVVNSESSPNSDSSSPEGTSGTFPCFNPAFIAQG